ncbi:MAG TPA: phosphatidylserine decarboxylase [Bacteroidetes bacterium]|nr:phosphatidylserine decarboxylase [Bacteroidota bacterium]
MKIARNTSSWIANSFVVGSVFLFLFIIFNGFEISFVLFFISIIFYILTAFFILFFRDPERNIGKGIVACADGKIREISNLKDKDIGECTRISTFMNIYNVHVNRMPVYGIIKSVKHTSGLHLPAFKKESEKNERVIILANTKIGLIKINLMAGTLARRIEPYIKEEDELKKGDKIGIIKLGSRVDVYLPSNKIKNIKVKVNDLVKAGETNIAEIND